MTYWYLASPYSKYRKGLKQAFADVCKIAGQLITMGEKIYCPIAHTHPIAILGDINPLDHKIWLPADAPFMEGASGLLIAEDMEGWEESYGIQQEIKAFLDMKKPICYFRDGVIYDRRKEG